MQQYIKLRPQVKWMWNQCTISLYTDLHVSLSKERRRMSTWIVHVLVLGPRLNATTLYYCSSKDIKLLVDLWIKTNPCWQQLCNSESVSLDVTLFEMLFRKAVLYTVTITLGLAVWLVTGVHDCTLNCVLNIRRNCIYCFWYSWTVTKDLSVW